MLDKRSIVITLKLTSSDETSTNNQTNTEQVDFENDKNKKAKAAYKSLAIQAAQTAISEVSAWAEYYWNKELMLNDDYVGMRNKNIAMTQINRGVNALTTIGSFTALGSAAGPWGAAIGAAVGTVVAAASIVRSNMQGEQQQSIQLRQMDAQLQFTRSRVGWSLKAASIGEDL